MNKYEITYFKNQDFDASFDIPYHVVVEAQDYEDGTKAFERLELGFLWSIDLVTFSQSSFTSKRSAEAFMATMDRRDLGYIEEKGLYSFIAHYPDKY